MKKRVFIAVVSIISLIVVTLPSPDARIFLDDPQLFITAPCTVTEGEQFGVIVTADGEPVEAVLVTFDNDSYLTDANGAVTLTAPFVNQSTFLPINASKVGYRSAEISIRVLDNSIPPLIEISIQQGFYFRIITATLKNGGESAENILWTITLSGGLILKGRNTSGAIPSLPMDQETSISSLNILGFSLHLIITVTAYPANGQLWSYSTEGVLIGPFLVVRD